jgi:hypothetical protein
MNYTIIVLVFIILMMLYMAYIYMTNTSLSSGVQPLNPTTAQTIPWTKLQNPSSSTYHYEGWVYVTNKLGSAKEILKRGTDSLKLNGTTLTFAYSGGSIEITTDFPLQKWVYIIVNVVNGTIVEVYLNGKLVLTKQVTLTIPITKSELTYGETGGIEGYITKVKRDPVALTPDEAWKTYLEGNGLATFSNFLAGYNASFSLYNTEGTIKQYTAL